MVQEKQKDIIGVGRRKTAVASVHLRKGTGTVTVNGKQFQEYFPLEMQRNTVLSPLKVLSQEGEYDLVIRVKGGGIEGQVIAARLGISRALVEKNEDVRKTLKELHYLTRDPRMKERKKYGHKKARKRFQFSKR